MLGSRVYEFRYVSESITLEDYVACFSYNIAILKIGLLCFVILLN